MATRGTSRPRVEQLLREGLNANQIAQALRAEGIDITASGVRDIRSRAGLASEHISYPEALPWEGMTRRHRSHHIAAMLRLDARIKRGEVVSEKMARLHKYFVSARTRANEVVHFDPDAPSGFIYLDRQPEDEPDSLIRTPEAMEKIRQRRRREGL